MKRYPLIEFMIKHGDIVAIATPALLVASAGYCWAVTGQRGAVYGGVLLAAVGYFVVRLLVEVLQVIAETLLPR